MILETLIDKSVYAMTNFVNSIEKVDVMERYLVHNLPILKRFNGVIIATNYTDLKFREYNEKMWRRYFPNCILIDLDKNRGHQIGCTDLDNAIINHCKSKNIKWVCKSASDIIITDSLLTTMVDDDSDFYYINGIGYTGIVEYKVDYNKIMLEVFYPQTNFYFLDVSKIDKLIPQTELEYAYNIANTTVGYTGNIQNYIENFCCEQILARCVVRNKLKKSHILNDILYKELLEMIYQYHICDPSFKNIMLRGICHYHYTDKEIIVLE